MHKELAAKFSDIAIELFNIEISPEVTRPETQFGDLSTNLALKLANRVGENPKELAKKIADKLQQRDNKHIKSVSIEDPGFINIRIKDEILYSSLSTSTTFEQSLKDKTVVTEYSNANPFKALHGGHLYTTLIGDAISNIFEAAGAQVKRINFGGDVGLHVAKAMWGIIDKLGGECLERLDEISESDRGEWISNCYVSGNRGYESSDKTRAEILSMNRRIYAIHKTRDKKSPMAIIYWTCRSWNYSGFKKLYEKLGVKPFDKYYPESATIKLGVEKVRQHTPEVYEESDGAIIFRGENTVYLLKFS